MDWCRVVGPRGLCRPLDEKHGFPLNNPHLAPCKGRTKWQTIAGRLGRQAGRQAGRAGRAGGRAGKGGPWPDQNDINGGEFGVLLYCLTAERSFAGRRHYRPRIPGRLYPPSPCCRDARPGASVGASSAHANGQRRSRQFRVLGFRV